MVFDKLRKIRMEKNNNGYLCGACSLRCLDLHPTIKLDSHGFSFFKVMERDFSSCLEISIPISIPFKFEENEELYVQLMGQSGQLWPAKLCIGDDGLLVLRNGWETFVSDNSLNVGDVVVFNHIFSTNFVVQVFGSNGNEKGSRRVESKSCIQGSGYRGNSKQIVKVFPQKRKKHGRSEEEELNPMSALVKIGFQETVEMAPKVSGLSSHHTAKKMKLKKSSALVRKNHETAGGKEINSESALVRIGFQETVEMAPKVSGLSSYHTPKRMELKKTSALVRKKRETAGDKEFNYNSALVKIGFQETVEMAPKASGLSYHTPEKEKPKKTSQTENAFVPINVKMSRSTFALALSQKLDKKRYPNFVKLLTDSAVGRGYRLSIPKNYRKTWLNGISEVIITSRDDDSYTWKQEIASYNQFYGFHGGSWKSFVQAHNLKKEDICIFELVDTNHFKVYILKLEDQWLLER